MLGPKKRDEDWPGGARWRAQEREGAGGRK